ncbi:hypothetical protein F5B21DRAFT_517614 [Xylaria acuta]|nr:hypothetical protein F5B21DRAFT_517614 [Xylaria acuta]
MSPPLIRKNLADLCTEEKDDLVRAFRAIQCLKPSDPDSYFTIAGYHGIPGSYYCHHGDVLFPTWHRAYLNRLEKALQKQVHGVTMPYWDQINTIAQGTIKDDGKGDGGHDVGLYNKPQGYATVRYPFSGLVSDEYRHETEEHNKIYEAMGTASTTQKLNTNVFTWLFASSYINDKGEKLPAGVRYRYKDCLDAPNYTAFSNTSSAEQWNAEHSGKVIYPLENPHNNIHAAVGGFEVPGDDDYDYIHFANGDMGENETAAFDPIFFFHHTWIDYMFWNWQVRHNSTHGFVFLKGYKGVDNYTPQSPLEPFRRSDGCTPLTSQDVANIADLGYTYDRLIPLPRNSRDDREIAPATSPRLRIPNLSRRHISGSFVISVWIENDEGRQDLISADAILSRWNLGSCDNCREHLDFQHFVPLLGWDKGDAENVHGKSRFSYKLHTRQNPDGLLGDRDGLPGLELETEGC